MQTRKIALFFMSICILFVAACTKADTNNNETSDPFIGKWKLVALSQNGQITDVTGITCLKDSYVNVAKGTYELSISAPNQQTNKCEVVKENGSWVNKNGNYYDIINGQESPLSINFNDNNQTMQFNMQDEDGNTFIMVFRK